MTPEPVTHPTLPPELRLFLEAIGFDPADEIDWDELDQAALQPIIRWRLAAQALNLNQHTAPSIGHLRQLATFPGFAENTLGPFFDLSSGPHPTEVALAEVMVKGVAERLTQHTAAMGRLATVIAESSKVLREALLPTHPELAEQEEADKAAGKSRLLRLATLAAQSIGSPTQIRDEDLCMLLQGAMPVGRRLHVAPATRAWTWTHEEHVSADFTSPGSAIRSAWRHLLGVLSGEGEWSLTSEQVGHALWLCGYHPGDDPMDVFQRAAKRAKQTQDLEAKLATIASIDPKLRHNLVDEVEMVRWMSTQTHRWESICATLGICATKDPPGDIAGFIDTHGGGQMFQDTLRAALGELKPGSSARTQPDLHDVLALLWAREPAPGAIINQSVYEAMRHQKNEANARAKDAEMLTEQTVAAHKTTLERLGWRTGMDPDAVVMRATAAMQQVEDIKLLFAEHPRLRVPGSSLTGQVHDLLELLDKAGPNEGDQLREVAAELEQTNEVLRNKLADEDSRHRQVVAAAERAGRERTQQKQQARRWVEICNVLGWPQHADPPTSLAGFVKQDGARGQLAAGAVAHYLATNHSGARLGTILEEVVAVLTFEQDHKQRHGVTVIHSPGFLLQRAQEVLRLIRLEVGNTEDTWNATLARVRQLATLVSNLAALQASADCPTAADISVDLAQLDIEAAGKRMVEDMRSLANYRGRACTKWPMCVELSREGGSAADAPTSSAEIVALRDALLTRGFASSDIDQMDVAKMRSELARCP